MARVGLGGVTLGAIVVAVILSAVFGGSDTTSSGGTAGSEDLAPNFSFTLYQGEDKRGAEKLDFAQLHGKPIVLNFWAGLGPPLPRRDAGPAELLRRVQGPVFGLL